MEATARLGLVLLTPEKGQPLSFLDLNEFSAQCTKKTQVTKGTSHSQEDVVFAKG